MKTKYLLIISIFIILMSMTCISASENVNQTESLGLSVENNFETAEDNQKIIRSTNNEDELKENKNQTMNSNILGISNNEKSLGATDNNEILCAPDDGTFRALQEKINNAEGTLVLENDYANTDNFDKNGIFIIKSLTIDGNGYTIDALSKGRIFTVIASNVILKNINFVNGYSDSGGAVYWSGARGVLSGSNFTGNNASMNGGAVYWNGDNGNLTGSNFTGNNASMNGGAVWWNGDNGNLTGSNFTGNNASMNGGAVWWNGDNGNLTGSNFTGNNANGNMGGGAVFWIGADGVLSGSNFTGNNASSGGAVSWYGSNGNLTGSTFTGNTATGDGGAVYFLNQGNVRNCNFTGNTATTGSAIYFYRSAQKSVSNSTFLNNRANAEYLQVIKNENIITIIFTGNDNLLNAIYSNGDVSFSNVTYWGANGIVNTNSYTPSRTNKESGQSITVEIYGSDDNLVENVTLVTDDKGQVTYDFIKLRNGEYKYKAYHIEDCYYTYAEYKDTFTLNSDLGDFNRLQKYINGASENSILTLCRDYTFTIGSDENLVNGIVIDKPLTINGNGYKINALQKARIFNVNAGNVVLNNITFTNATASGDGGAIYFSESGTVENCNFAGNTATDDGGAVYFENAGNVINCNFTGNTATGSGGAVYFVGTGDVINCNFTGNTATRVYGGAIYSKVSGTVSNCNFTGNTATGTNSRGGAIRMGNGNVSNCNFTGNTATHGGAVYFVGNGNVTNCNFTDNKATGTYSYGGAVYFQNTGNVTNCNFSANTATGSDSGGGAVYFAGNGNVTNCNFTGNTATGTYSDGGAVYFNNQGNVSNCNFTGNTATDGDGGAIIMSSGTVSNCNFSGNTATDGDGGAIIMSSGTVSNCNFTGNTATDGDGGAILMSSGTVLNCNFTGNNATGYGGAIYSKVSGTVSNCNFTGNNATRGGAVYFLNNGNVTNCNFTGNKATNGGAIMMHSGTVSNCNFTGNTATGNGGAVYFVDSGDVINCNFSANTATESGGAVRFWNQGNVTNCNFTGNNATGNGGAIRMSSGGVSNCNFTDNTATTGSAIYFHSTSEQKSVSNSTFLNNRANAKDLQVTKNENNITITFTGNNNILNAIYSRNDAEVSFSNVTYWGANGIVNTDTFKPSISNNAAGQNITVSIVINDKIDSKEVYVTDKNGKIVLNRNVGDNYFIGVCHDTDSYYTEILNSTSNNTKFSVSVNNQTSNNRRVNITAKSNIPNEVLKGKLLFILPNSTQINANYTANGTWWAVHEFDDAGDYDINASYIGLDGVIINNATISIRYDASVDVNNRTLDLFVEDTFNLNATTNPKNLPVNFTSSNPSVVTVDKNGKVVALSEGNATIIVSVGGDGKYAENSTTVNVTVSKVPTSISIENDTINLEVNDEMGTGATLNPPDAGNLTYNLSNGGIVKIEDGEIIALKEGNVTITVSFKGNNKYLAAENKTINVTVTLKNARVSVNNNTLDLFVDDTFTIVANTTPKGLKVTYKPDNSGIISVDNNGVVTALKEGNTTIIVSVGDNKVYAENTTTVTVTVRKIPTEILITNETLDLKVNDKVDSGAGLNPSEAGNLTYTISETSIIKLLDNQIIALSEGSATITYSFAGNDKYAAAQNKTITVKVSLNDASVRVNNNTLNLLIDDTFTIIATTVPDGLNVTYMPDNSGIISIDENGLVTALKEGTAPIIVKVGGDGVYAENTTIVTVTVKKVNPTMNITADEITEGENATINIELPIDATGNVTTTVNGKTYSSPVDNGKAIITIPGLEYGNYTLPVTYSGDDKYDPLTKDVDLTVNEDEIVVSAPDLIKYYSGSEKFVVNVSYANGRAIAGKEVKITINGVTYKRTTDENGSASLSINLNSATYDTVVEVDNITVDSLVMILPTIEAEDVESKSKNLTFKAVFLDGEGNYLTNGTNVSFNINGVIYDSYVNDDKGSVSLNLTLDRGRYIITSYNPVSGESVSNDIAVDLKDADMFLSGDEITAGENATIGVTLPGDATGNVTTSLNGKNYTSQVNNGKADIIIPDLASGNYTISVTYSGDNNYNPAVGEVNITVNENATVTINAENLTKYYKDSERFTVKITDAKGQPAANKTVEITINGVTYKRTTDENGTASLSINLNSGVYPVRVVVDGVEANFTVTVQSTIDSSDIVKIFRNGTQYNAIFTDSNGTPLPNIEVSFNIHGVIYNRTTDRNGASKLDINLDAGDYIITAFNSATGEMKSNTIKVISLIESDDLTKYYKNASQFVVRIHSANGAYVGAGEEVSFNINGVIYTRLTNATGHAKLNINLHQGNYTITTYYNGCRRGNNIEVLSILTAEDLSMKYMDGSQFKAQLVDGQGNPYPKQTVTFNINGVFYNRLSDNDGVAKLNIRLMTGQYIITSSYNGCNISNKITIWG